VRGALIDGRTSFHQRKTTMSKLIDFLGRVIRAGDLIVYPWRRGSQMGLNKMSVTQVTDSSVDGYSNTGRPVKITNVKNVVVVERPQTEPPTESEN